MEMLVLVVMLNKEADQGQGKDGKFCKFYYTGFEAGPHAVANFFLWYMCTVRGPVHVRSLQHSHMYVMCMCGHMCTPDIVRQQC